MIAPTSSAFAATLALRSLPIRYRFRPNLVVCNSALVLRERTFERLRARRFSASTWAQLKAAS
jgi:hypothetical protein